MDRRSLLGTLGVVSTGSLVGLAGCGGDGAGNGGDDTVSESDYPPIESWLTETDVGGADDSYDGTILDRRGQDEVLIDVGSEGNGGNFAFGPRPSSSPRERSSSGTGRARGTPQRRRRTGRPDRRIGLHVQLR